MTKNIHGKPLHHCVSVSAPRQRRRRVFCVASLEKRRQLAVYSKENTSNVASDTIGLHLLTENIPRTSGEVRVRFWDDFRSPPGNEAYQLTAHHHQGCQCQGGEAASWHSSVGESDSLELARKSVFDNATSHSTAFLLNSIHQTFWRCCFYTTAVKANAWHPRPTNLFQTAANEGCNASR